MGSGEVCCSPGFPWGQGHVGLAPWHLLWLLWGRAQPQGPHGIATPGDLCHHSGDLEAPLAQPQSWCTGTALAAVGLPLGDSGISVGQGQNAGQGQDHNRGRSQSTMWGGTRAPGVEPGPHEQEVRTSPVLQEDAQPRGSPRQVTGPAAAPCPHPLPCCAGLPMPCTFWGLLLLSSQPGASPTLVPHAEPPHPSARTRSSCLSP